MNASAFFYLRAILRTFKTSQRPNNTECMSKFIRIFITIYLTKSLNCCVSRATSVLHSKTSFAPYNLMCIRH